LAGPGSREIGAVGLRHGGDYPYAWAIGDRAGRRRTVTPATTARPGPKRLDG
jgi:hypothetical protein